MCQFRLFLLLSLLFALIMFPSCSGGGNPVSPDKTAGAVENTPAISLADANGSLSGLGIMGAYELTIDPTNMTAEIVSKRMPAVGESYIVSGINFFTNSPCVDCLKLIGIELNGANVALKFRIKHPFDPGDPSLPPTAKNRLDLDLFDLAMVMRPKSATPKTYSLTGTDIYTGTFTDTAGYTRELANVIGDDTALPYYLVVDDSITEISTWNEFAMGATKEFKATIILTPGGSLAFDMYLTMGYGASAKKLQRLTPKYYNPEFNRKAAWKVEVMPYGEWTDNDSTTPVNVEVRVYDWQIGATVYGTPADFANASPDNIYAASEVASVSVEIPGMNSTLPTVTTPDAGLGTPASALLFNVPVVNENLLAAGEYTGIVKVLDERPCLTVPDGRDIIIDKPEGITLNNYTMPEYATYQTFTASVIKVCTTGLCWAKRAGGTAIDNGNSITTLSDNSTVVTGSFSGSATFGLDETNETTLTAGGYYDIYIARYNPDGTLSWVKRAGGPSVSAISNGITTLSDNSVVVSGFFEGTSTFGQGETNQTILTSNEYQDIFIARYNPDGTLAWAKCAGGIYYDVGYGITSLSDNSTVMTGIFQDSATFGQGEPNQTIVTSPTGSYDIFIARYNPDGTLAWAKRAGGINIDEAWGITSLSDNSTVVAGEFESSATFGQGETNQTILTSIGSWDIFIARYNPDGTLAWAKRAGGSGMDQGIGVTVLSDNSTVMTGNFIGSATFGQGETNQTILTSVVAWDIFITRYNPNGTLAWAKRVGGNGDQDSGLGITTLSDNSTVVTGRFGNSATFGPGEPNETTLSGDGMFIARYNPDGMLSWAKSVGGATGRGITNLSDDSIVVTGVFAEPSATFGPGEPNETILTCTGALDIFIARYKY